MCVPMGKRLDPNTHSAVATGWPMSVPEAPPRQLASHAKAALASNSTLTGPMETM
jgi:hypothetical protein